MQLSKTWLLGFRGRTFCLWTMIFLFLGLACKQQGHMAKLLVRAPSQGEYEIYRVSSTNPMQFTSDHIGKFNEPLELRPGFYLLLADCSYQSIELSPNQTTSLTAHEVRFVAPVEPTKEDFFAIQCNRFDKTRSRQSFTNRYELHVLSGERELLVGMQPLSISINKTMDQMAEPMIQSFELAAMKVNSFKGMHSTNKYFLSPAGDLLSVTEPQDFGHWQFILPGHYIVELNGTINTLELKPGELRVIQPSFLEIDSPPGAPIERAEQIAGSPLFVELNGKHWLSLNEEYPVLPGPLNLRLSHALKPDEYFLREGEALRLKTKSLEVKSACAIDDWRCLGSKNVYLYQGENGAPIAQGLSDVPLLYFGEQIYASIEGSKDIRFKLPAEARVDLHLGSLRLVPRLYHRVGQITDLVRIEPGAAQIVGQTIDLDLEKLSEISLIAGHYHLAQYVSFTGAEGDRKKFKRPFLIRPKETEELEIQVFVSDRKWASFKEQDQTNIAKKSKRDSPSLPAESNKFQDLGEEAPL